MQEEALFLAALELEGAERQAWLEANCGGDAKLRARIEALLRSHEQEPSFLHRPALEQLAAHAASESTHDRGDRTRIGLDAEASRLVVPLALRNLLQPPELPQSQGRLAHYELLEILGSGGFGFVFKAIDQRLHRLVAVKVVLPELAASEEGRQRFLREARLAAAVKHDHVVDVYAVEETPLPYLVMEYVEGPTLEQLLKRQGALPAEDVIRVGREIAQGLAAAHAQGLIHRDIKPSNILLERASGRIKITDFGLARAVDDTSLTRAGLLAGTPQFMSPEQAEGKAVDPRSDLFSLGSVLYTLATGVVPFSGDTTLAVLRGVCERTPKPMRALQPGAPEFLEALVARLHAKSPEERLQSAQEVVAALEERREVSAPRKQRRMPLIIAAVIVIALVIGVLHPWSWLSSPQRDRAAAAAALAAQSTAADELDPATIPPGVIELAGGGIRTQAPAGLRTVLGEQRFSHVTGGNRNSGIVDIAYSRDGRRVATAAVDFSLDPPGFAAWELKIWKTNGDLERNFAGLSSAVRGLALDPSGERVVIVCDDGSLKVLRIADGETVWSAEAHEQHGRAVAWSPDGMLIVSGGSSHAAVWNATTGERQRLFDKHSSDVLDVDFSSDSRRIVSVDGRAAIVWDAAAGEVVSEFRHEATARGAVFSSDDQQAISVSEDGVGYVWNVADGKLVEELKGHAAGVLAIARSPDKQHVATASLDGTARIWSLADGKLVHSCPRHLLHCTSVAFNANGSELMSGDAVGRLYRWNTATGECLNEQHLGPVTAVTISADGRHAISGGTDATIRAWDLATGHMLRKWKGDDEIRSLAVTAEGAIAAASGKKILLRNIEGSAQRDIATDSAIQQVLFADGATLLSLEQDGAIRLWNVTNGEQLQQFALDKTGQCLALTPDGKMLAIAIGNEIHLRYLPGGEELGVITGHTEDIVWLAFHPEGHQLASCAQGDDASVRLWDIDKHEEVERLEGHLRGARSCAFRADGNLLVTCGNGDGTLQLWDLFDARPRRKVLPVSRTNVAALQGFALTPEGRYAVTAHSDGSLYVLRLAKPGEVLRVER